MRSRTRWSRPADAEGMSSSDPWVLVTMATIPADLTRHTFSSGQRRCRTADPVGPRQPLAAGCRPRRTGNDRSPIRPADRPATRDPRRQQAHGQHLAQRLAVASRRRDRRAGGGLAVRPPTRGHRHGRSRTPETHRPSGTPVRVALRRRSVPQPPVGPTGAQSLPQPVAEPANPAGAGRCSTAPDRTNRTVESPSTDASPSTIRL